MDEPDRFMRSCDEAAYFEVTFKELGVRVWYASDAELNKGDLASRLLKFTKFLSAEGSNEERQRKSIAGQTKALRDGRYPFSPKPGYRRGYEKGIQEIADIKGPALKRVLERLASNLLTPTEALKELNKSEFTQNHAPYKMDKFRKIATDPFYAGIVEIKRQVNVRNESGLHEPLITKEQHYALLRIMNEKTKNQSGPREGGNTEYPCNNIVSCDNCVDKKNGRIVGFNHTNGKTSKIYQRYRCRGCGLYMAKEELHQAVKRQFERYILDAKDIEELVDALERVWKQKECDNQQESIRLGHNITTLQTKICNQVIALADPSNKSIVDEIRASIERNKAEIEEAEDRLAAIKIEAKEDKKAFLVFALDFVNNMGDKFFDESVPLKEKLMCKQIVFPASFRISADKKVYTPEISPLYTLRINKKGAETPSKSYLVQHS